jgi:hypothetical protein
VGERDTILEAAERAERRKAAAYSSKQMVIIFCSVYSSRP